MSRVQPEPMPGGCVTMIILLTLGVAATAGEIIWDASHLAFWCTLGGLGGAFLAWFFWLADA